MHVQDYITILATLHALQKYKIQDFAALNNQSS